MRVTRFFALPSGRAPRTGPAAAPVSVAVRPGRGIGRNPFACTISRRDLLVRYQTSRRAVPTGRLKPGFKPAGIRASIQRRDALLDRPENRLARLVEHFDLHHIAV